MIAGGCSVLMIAGGCSNPQQSSAAADNIQFYSYWWIYQFGQIYLMIAGGCSNPQQSSAAADNIQFYSYWWIYQFGQIYLYIWYILSWYGQNIAQQLSTPPDNI